MRGAGIASFGGWAGLAARLGVTPPSSHRSRSRSRVGARSFLRAGGGGDEGLKRFAGGGEGSRLRRGSGLVLLGPIGARSSARPPSRSAAGAVGGWIVVATGAVSGGCLPR